MFSIRVDDRSFQRAFSDLEKRQIPFATVTALNEIAVGVRGDLRENMGKVFDQPTTFTLNAFYVKKARKSDLTAWVGIREYATKGTPAWKYLTPQTEGGARAMKRFELRLSGISGGQFVLPGAGATMDANGNMSRGQIGQILSRLGSMNDPQQNMTEKTAARLSKQGKIARGARSEYFVARGHGSNRRPIGVYKFVGKGQVVPVLIFTPKAPTYRARFDPDAVVVQSLNKRGKGALERALAHALATAK